MFNLYCLNGPIPLEDTWNLVDADNCPSFAMSDLTLDFVT